MASEKRLIDANEIEELFYKQVEYGATDLMDAFNDALQDAQTVDAVEVKHGQWVEVDDGVLIGKGTHFECSECGKWENWGRLSNFCPHCGADMR